MCGVLGILGNYSIRTAQEILLLLAHRGQDAAGLLWTNQEGIMTAKAMGSPREIDIPDELSNQILGSTRYPTSGRRVASDDELDTFVGPFNVDQISLTHNGNITNMKLFSDHSYDCDGEFIAERLSVHLDKNGGVL